MAVYKVPQDVEAEDKLIGFLTMKQFIFTVIAALLSVLAFKLGQTNILFITPFIPFIAVFAILGLYQRKDQKVETFLLAALRYYLKPHRRVWSQDGVMETVKITAPKRARRQYSDGLTKTQVKSNLNRLAMIMDTRGWAAKNAALQPNVIVPGSQEGGDRLIELSQIMPSQPQEVHDSDDILDTATNPTAQYFNEMMAKEEERLRQEAVQRMRQAAQAASPAPAPTAAAAPAAAEEPMPKLEPRRQTIHQKVIAPPEEAPQPATRQNGTNENPAPQPPRDDILKLAEQGDNLSVETISKEAERIRSLNDNQSISLH